VETAPGYPLALMATRTIVTSQPDVACYVCERRLLRGEQPEVFLVGGRPRTVCELCAPRAAHAGWLREVEGDSVSVAPLRARRGRNLFERLRQVGKGAQFSPRGATSSAGASSQEESDRREPEPYDFVDSPERPSSVPANRRGAAGEGRIADPSVERAPSSKEARRSRGNAVRAGAGGGTVAGGGIGADASAADADPADGSLGGLLDRAVEVFNGGDYPRRVAGLSRSLGSPDVTVHPLEGIPNVAEIVVAWELCWYRYRVDLDEAPLSARARAQGTHLSELPREDLLANAVVDELGAVSLSGAYDARGASDARPAHE
jgi:hypothetical protein